MDQPKIQPTQTSNYWSSHSPSNTIQGQRKPLLCSHNIRLFQFEIEGKTKTGKDMATRRVRYTPLATDEDDYIGDENRTFDPRFDYTPKALDKVPWKSIALALFLLFLGTGLLFLSYFIFTGHMGGERSQAYGLLALGFLSFLPGFYETRIAYYAWRGAKGYRFSAIPDY
ncbi:Transmembrane protein 230, partial [Mucuna pruriens]